MAEAEAPIGPEPMSLAALRKSRKPLKDLDQARRKNMKPLDRLAVWTTARVGTMGFFLLIFGWTVLWLGWNLLAPKPLRFDPPMGFVLWLFISNMIQILLMPLIMVGQNVQGAQSDARAEHDLTVNVRAEEEIEIILQHLEYQNSLLLRLMREIGSAGAHSDAAK